MRRLLLTTTLLLASAGAVANSFVVGPHFIAGHRAEPSPLITLYYTPSQGASRAEVDLAIPLDHVGWYSVQAVPSTGAHVVTCALRDGVVTAKAWHPAGLGLPPQSLSLCRITVRAHDDTRIAGYGLSLRDAAASDRFGNLLSTQVRGNVYRVVQ